MKLYAKEKGGEVYSHAAFALGQYYFNHGQLKEAAEYLAMVQKKERHYGEAQFYAGLAYWKLGEDKKALTSWYLWQTKGSCRWWPFTTTLPAFRSKPQSGKETGRKDAPAAASDHVAFARRRFIA